MLYLEYVITHNEQMTSTRVIYYTRIFANTFLHTHYKNCKVSHLILLGDFSSPQKFQTLRVLFSWIFFTERPAVCRVVEDTFFGLNTQRIKYKSFCFLLQKIKIKYMYSYRLLTENFLSFLLAVCIIHVSVHVLNLIELLCETCRS